MYKLAGILLVSCCAGGVSAREYAPRVVSPERADAYSMRTFAEFPRWRGLQGDALAWEVYRYLVDTRSGLFHCNEVLEGGEPLPEFAIVRDPVKIINVYGYGFCGLLGPVMAGIWEDMGKGPSRTVSLPGWSHVASEVFYGGAWHYMDLDVRAVFRRADGSLASLAEARQDPALWRGRGPLFFPEDSLDSTQKIYRQTRVEHYHGFQQSGHTMDYVLRQGERLTRWWTPQGGRWHHPGTWNSQAWLLRLLEQEPRGPKPNHRGFSVHNHANGRFVYCPDLSEKSTDFADGAYDAHNVRPAAEGLTLAAPGEGHVVFEVRSPYVIVPRVGRTDTEADDGEASVIEMDGHGVSLGLSLDGGLTWREVRPEGEPSRLDLTPYVRGRYGYLLKIALRAQLGQALIRRLQITTWVQVAPAALPLLSAGTNRMEYRTGDHYGLKTRVKGVRSEAWGPDELLKYLVSPPADYDPARKTERIHGPVVVQVAPPPGARIAWFTAEGSFRTHQLEAARKTRNTMAYAAEDAEKFQEIYRAEVPADTEHWHYNAHREVRLAQPARQIYVRYVGDPGLNNFHVYAHCLDDARPSAGPVSITYTWRDNGGLKTHTAKLDGPGTFEITAGEHPVCESVDMAVPSVRRESSR